MGLAMGAPGERAVAPAGRAFGPRIAAGFDSRRPLPPFASRSWLDGQPSRALPSGPAVVLFADTFNNWMEPGNLAAARRVIEATGHAVIAARAPDGKPLCCGRTYLSAGMAGRARAQAARLLEALGPFIERGTPVIGLEPSCLFTLKDEFLGLFPGDPRAKALAELATPFETFAATHLPAVNPALWQEGGAREYLVHGHCHQKAFDTFGHTLAALRAVPGARVSAIESGCCGMAGSFGHEHYDESMAMAELSLLPAVRKAAAGTVVVAAGTSCRGQIGHGAHRAAVHPAVALADALAARP